MKYALTYYDHSENLWQEGEQREMLALWKESFSKFGWTPVVLNIEDIRTHPRFDFFFEHFNSKPTEYPRTFTNACWLRWLAAAHFGMLHNEEAVGLFDMDVCNYGLEPANPEPGKMEILCDEPPASIFLGAVLGTPQHFLDIAELFCAWKPDDMDFNHRIGMLHQDDLSMLVRMFHPIPGDTARPKPEFLVKKPGCALFDYSGYRTSKLVHFGSGAMKARGLWPKYKYIKAIRPF